MNSAELKKAKVEVRRRVLALRDSIPGPERDRLGRLVAERFLALPEVGSARLVMLFWSFGSEVPTEPLIGELVDRGVEVALPRTVDRQIQVVLWKPGDPTTQTPFGASEPAEGGTIAPGRIDVVATPAVAFDRRGRRVGYGGGFYDRFLAATRPDAVRVGVGFDLQLLEEELPVGDFDLPVDIVVTASETIRCAAG